MLYRGSIGAMALMAALSWSLAGVFANHVQSRSYVYIATSLAGVASLATINAIGLLFRPVSILVNAWGASALNASVTPSRSVVSRTATPPAEATSTQSPPLAPL